MKVRHVLAVVAVVLLAGCFGILGGGGGGNGTATPGGTADGGLFPNATEAGSGTDAGTATQAPMDGTPVNDTATPAPTATPTATVTPTATPTPLPESFETTTVENESLGLSVELTGDPAVLSTARTGNLTGSAITQGGVLECARVSPFAAAVTNGTVADTTVTMSYDPAKLPEGANESELAVFTYNRTVKFYLPMNGTVDAENDRVVATEIDGRRNAFTNDETGEVLRVVLDGTRMNNAFVVMHAPTFWEGFETGEVPDRCGTEE